MDSVRRVQFVTKRYLHLQGLRLVSLGLPFLASGAWRAGHLRWLPGAAGAQRDILFGGGYILALMTAVALGRYYRLRFGSVQPLPSLPGVLSAVGLAVILVAAVWVQTAFEWHIPVSLPLLIVGLALAYVGIAGGYVRVHYLAVAAATVALATLGMFVTLNDRDVLFDYLIGGGLIVIGIGDHLLLRNTLEPYPHARTI
jgi:hypothetical protein